MAIPRSDGVLAAGKPAHGVEVYLSLCMKFSTVLAASFEFFTRIVVKERKLG